MFDIKTLHLAYKSSFMLLYHNQAESTQDNILR